jgi:hypothetical protein
MSNSSSKKAKMRFCDHISLKNIFSHYNCNCTLCSLFYLVFIMLLSIYPRMVILIPPVKLLYILFSPFVVVNRLVQIVKCSFYVWWYERKVIYVNYNWKQLWSVSNYPTFHLEKLKAIMRFWVKIAIALAKLWTGHHLNEMCHSV